MRCSIALARYSRPRTTSASAVSPGRSSISCAWSASEVPRSRDCDGSSIFAAVRRPLTYSERVSATGSSLPRHRQRARVRARVQPRTPRTLPRRPRVCPSILLKLPTTHAMKLRATTAARPCARARGTVVLVPPRILTRIGSRLPTTSSSPAGRAPAAPAAGCIDWQSPHASMPEAHDHRSETERLKRGVSVGIEGPGRQLHVRNTLQAGLGDRAFDQRSGDTLLTMASGNTDFFHFTKAPGEADSVLRALANYADRIPHGCVIDASDPNACVLMLQP